ncbi:hypothetical protein GQ457_16G031000 [Hibiscus cannabinus]
MLKDVILEQLLISCVNFQRGIANISIIDDIKKKGLRLSDIAPALKCNVHKAATLIYLIKLYAALELLPTLMDLICTSNGSRFRPSKSITVTPAASLMIIEVLVTAFDNATNNMHLAAINPPHILSRFLDVARNHSLEEHISLATILVKCMQFDGKCRKYISQAIAVAPFIHLLQSKENRAVFIALEFFHESLRIPRSSVISLLQQIQRGGIDIMDVLVTCVRCFRADYRIMAANLLLQLDTLVKSST